ncbi:unnamed protein product [Owenia fusiformis]|uniref:Uncharacterized protein n=1 Tax=Owenia fusiformis TaxID=6347 RepID=A0A8J1Y5Y7_OWEFU|nr:unnamed protein product [Owenia fusiformis]
MAAETMLRSVSRPPTHIMAVMPDKPRVPLVSHTITDEDIGALAGSRVLPVNLNKSIKLLTDPHSATLYDRHLNVLKKITRHYQKGFLMKDLVQVCKILNVCADRIEEQSLYIEPMCDILKICSLPYLKERTSDETTFEQIAIESVSQLGYLMRVPSPEVRKQICKTLISFYTEKPPQQHVQRHKASTLNYNKKIVEKSDVSETLVKSLALLETDLKVRLAVLNVLQKFSKKSALCCDQMLSADAAHKICTRLNDVDKSGQLMFLSVDILWNLLENGDQAELAAQLNNFTCVGQLRDAFIQQLTQGYSHYDRQLRNDLLVIASLIASYCPEAPFLETGYVKQLALFATFQEVKSHNAIVRYLKLGTNHEDFELKKLLINALVILSKEPAVIPVLSEGHVLLALFSYVRANENISAPREWTPAQFEEIQLHAMSALCTLAPVMVEDFVTCQGSTRLLLLLEWCVGREDYGGHGNSFHGAGGRGNKRAQMRRCLQLLRSMISTGHEGISEELVDQGAINQITTILDNVSHSSEDDDAIDVEMQCDMLFLLSSLTEFDMHRKELFGVQGVDVCIEYLKMNPKKISSGLGHHKLMLATVDCIWCSIVGCYLTEDAFLEKEGVFLLIDLLESCPKNMHNLIIGCLLDLAENPKTVPHIISWRGKEDISAAHLFCDIWRHEEEDIGVEREESGAIADTTKPLVGALQKDQGVIPLPANCPSQAIVDVSENMRAKIYAIFCKIGFVDLPGLTTEDHVTLTIVERYLDFKVGEVWSEVIQELEVENIRPVTPDREALETITRVVDEDAIAVSLTQKQLLHAKGQQDLLDEQEFYAEIRENHRQKEKALNDFADYVARTSNYSLLRAAKERQDLSVDASRVQTEYKNTETYHDMAMESLQTTTFSGRMVNIDSTPAEITGGPLANHNCERGLLIHNVKMYKDQRCI